MAARRAQNQNDFVLILASQFTAIDWSIVGAYLLLVLLVGALASRKSDAKDGFFLASRSMPMWAVALSVLATAQSAATFIGGPEQAYRGNLTYLTGNIGQILGVLLVAFIFIPAFYRQKVTSIYEVIGNGYGPGVQRVASMMFLLGRSLASGARLYIVAIPFAFIVFGKIEPQYLVQAIVIIAIVATSYTLFGGIRAVIWTDVLQAVVYIGTIATAIAIILHKIPVDMAEIAGVLRENADASTSTDKLKLFDFELSTWDDLARPWNFWAIILGMSLFNLAAYGTDQDLAQRMLTCRSSRSGSWSVIVSTIITLPVVALFLLMGLLLFVFYQRPDVIGSAMPAYDVDDSRKVLLTFIMNEIPIGVRGLMLAGVFAASMSSMDSALNAMASSTMTDLAKPLTRNASQKKTLLLSRLAVAVWAIVLAGVAMLCVAWHDPSNTTLIDFALGVMVFAYGGLLGVFLTVLLTRRGNALSAAAAMIAGVLVVLAMQGFSVARLNSVMEWNLITPWIGWRMFAATLVSFGICCTGHRGPVAADQTA